MCAVSYVESDGIAVELMLKCGNGAPCYFFIACFLLVL
jgi:hypothetical protein